MRARLEAEALAFRMRHDGTSGIAVIRDGNGTRAVETMLRYRNAAMAELLRCQRTLAALQAAARAGAGVDAMPPAWRRGRARPRPKDMPPKRTLTTDFAARSQDRVADRSPAARPATPPAIAPEAAVAGGRAANPRQGAPGPDRPDEAPRLPATAPEIRPARPTTAPRLDLPVPHRSHRGATGGNFPDAGAAALLSAPAQTERTRENQANQ